MKVILLEDVKSLGSSGDVVEVSEGYARNFLYPGHLAIEATEQKLREMKEKEKAAERQSKKAEKEDRKLAAALDDLEVTIAAKADEGTLYAAVGPKDIAKALKGMGHSVKAENIAFEPQKEVGEYEAHIDLPSGYEATLTIIIEEAKE